MSRPFVVVLGGTRSGKSRFGRARADSVADGGPIVYVATALRGDPELDDRIRRHRQNRPADWSTIEAGVDLPDAIRAIPDGTTILLDGLTLWVALLMDGAVEVDAILSGPIAELRAALADHRGPAIVVSDEVGLGSVPLDPGARLFRDVLGITHQQLVGDAEEAWLTVAGRALRLDAGVAIP